VSNMLFDHYPAEIYPWPEDVPHIRVRAVGFPEGLVLIWDEGGNAPTRKEILADGVTTTKRHAAGYDVERGAGCACGSRRLRSMKVLAPVVTEPQPLREEGTGVPVESPV
jgi:hypothetical protein